MKSTLVPVGSLAPGFTLQDREGRHFRLGEDTSGPLLLVFFRGFWCESCQAQLSRLRAEYQELIDRDVTLLAISADSVERSRAGIHVTGLPFTVLCDPERSVIARYGVLHQPEETGPGIAKPSVFLLDHTRTVRFAYIGDDAADRPNMQTLLLAIDSLGAR